MAYGMYKDSPEEHLPTKYSMTKILQSPVIQCMMDINMGLHQLSTSFLTKHLEILLPAKEQEQFLRIDN